MIEILENHQAAMNKAEIAFIRKFHGDEAEASRLFLEALDLERKAAFAAMQIQAEPTVSVLFRSAASLAYHAGEFREAERLAAYGLVGNTPDDVADEIRSLLEDIHFDRHMRLQGVALGPSEVQMVIAGHGVAYGMASSDEVVSRLGNFEQLAQRTVERKLGRPFREKGSFPDELRSRYQPFIAKPRSASLAFTIRLGLPTGQMDAFEDAQSTQDVLDDIVENIALINAGREDELRERIPDEAYYQNFLGRTKAIAPDGEGVSLVGFTLMRKGAERHFRLQRTKKQISMIPGIQYAAPELPNVGDDHTVSVTGRLFIANAQKGYIGLDAGDKKMWKIVVPKGLTDIVRNYFEETVTVHGFKVKKDLIEMTDLDPAGHA